MLRFEDRALEDAFRDDYRARVRGSVRVATVVALALMATFGALDVRLLARPGPTLLLRYGVICPVILAATVTTFVPRLGRWVEPVSATATVLVGWAMAWMLAILFPIHEWIYHTSILLTLSFAYSSLRLRCATAIATGALITLGYGGTVVALAPAETAITVVGLFAAANVAGATTALHLERTMREGFVARRAAEDLAMRDALTGLGNRRALEQKLAEMIAIFRRYGAHFCVLLIDLDDFKRVNEHHGHVVGDALLREIARAIGAAVRDSDAAYRYGGDEFVVVAPATDATGGRRLAERLLAGLPERVPGASHAVTFSAGVCAIAADVTTGDQLIAAAGEPLRRAKLAGKRQVMV